MRPLFLLLWWMLLTPVVIGGTNDLFGPLAGLEGTWFGRVGLTSFPKETGSHELVTECYYEIQTYSRMYPVSNDIIGETIYAMTYEVKIMDPQGKPFHNENGQWLWLPATKTVVRQGVVPRGQMMQAGGLATLGKEGSVQLTVSAAQNSTWGLLNTPVMAKALPTVRFESAYHVYDGMMWYNDTSTLIVDGKLFRHSDANCLYRGTQADASATTPECPKYPIFCAV